MAETININSLVAVRLTRYGKAVYHGHIGQIRKIIFSKAKHPNSAIRAIAKLYDAMENDEFIEMQLWELMEVFGPSMCLSMAEPPFVANEIKLLNGGKR